MIIELLFNAIKGLIYVLFSLLPNIPSMPNSLIESVNSFLDLAFNNSIILLGLFVRISTIKIIVPILIVIITFDKIYSLFIWVLKKLPISTE